MHGAGQWRQRLGWPPLFLLYIWGRLVILEKRSQLP